MSVGEKDQPGISGGRGSSAEPGCVLPVPGSQSRHLVSLAQMAPGQRMKEQIYGGLLLCVHCSGRQGSKTRDTSSPVLRLLDKNIPSPPFQRRRTSHLSPDLQGLSEAGEARVPSCVGGEGLDDSPKVMAPRAPARSGRSPVLARVSGSGIGCHSAGLPIARLIWLRGLLSLEGLDYRYMPS